MNRTSLVLTLLLFVGSCGLSQAQGSASPNSRGGTGSTSPSSTGSTSPSSTGSADPVGFRRRTFPENAGGKRIALGDVDNDGDPDALLSGRLFLNDGKGNFDWAPRAVGLRQGARAAIFLDYDHDGDLDVFLSSPDRLLRNDLCSGKLRFTDVSAAAGIIDDGLPGEGLAAGDVNGDGFPDVFLANYEATNGGANGTPDKLYLSDGRGGFTLSSEVSSRRCGRGVNMGDFDQDGDLDIYVSNYRLQENRLYVNQLRETGGYSLRGGDGLGLTGGDAHTIGSTWGDLDCDGDLDLVMGNFSHPGQRMVSIYRQSGGRFSRTKGWELGIAWEEAHANPTLFDLDDDGDLDLYLTATYGRKSHFYRNLMIQGGNLRPSGLRFRNGTDHVRGAVYGSWGCAAADVDLDGDQDLVVCREGGRAPTILLNERAQRRQAKSVRIRLRGRKSDTWGVGATAILTGGGARRTVRQLSMGHGTSSQSEPILHFGVGTAPGPFRVEIRWPSGKVSKTKLVPGRHEIKEPK